MRGGCGLLIGACRRVVVLGVAVGVLGLLSGFVVPGSGRAADPAWSVQAVPAPSSPNGQLVAVSCVSSTVCVAVGSYVNSANVRVPLAESWDGASWSVQPTPSPDGGTEVELDGVSCTSASDCTAVGSYDDAGGTQVTLAERW